MLDDTPKDLAGNPAGPIDHGIPDGTRVQAIRPASGACIGTGTVTEDRDKHLPMFESRWVFPIAVRDDNGQLYHYQPGNLTMIEQCPQVG